MVRRSILAALALSLACSSPSPPRPRPPGPDPVTPAAVAPTPPPAVEGPAPLWPHVRSGKLANGLTYYVMPHHQPEKRVSLWLAVNAGSLQEDDDQQGLAHFVEHMAFNGTAKYPKQAIIDYLEKIGMEFGPDVNAYTSFDETVYMLQVPTDDPSFVATGLDILRQWAGAISFEPVEVDKERGVVLEEWRLGRGADERIFDKQAPVLFGGTRYADRLPIGKPEIITKGSRDAALRFYRDWYRPELMAVIVVGDVTPDAIVPQVERLFGDLTNPTTARPRPGGGALASGDVRIAIDTDAELRRTSIELSALFPRRRESHRSDYRRFVIDGLYHQMFGARLAKLARRPDAPFVMAFSSTGAATREFESYGRTVFAKDGQTMAALEVLIGEEARVARHGFTAGELARAKLAYANRAAVSAAEWDQEDASEYASELTRHFFEQEIVIGRVAEEALAAEALPTITLDEVSRAAAEWTTGATQTIAIAAPADAKGVPTAAEVRARVAAVMARPTEPWPEEPTPTSLLATAPTPGKIVAETPADQLDVIRWTLSNGAKVVLRPTTFDNQKVVLSAISTGGTAQWSDARFAKARLVDAAIDELGVGALTADQVEQYLADKAVAVWPYLGEQAEGLGGQAATDDLPTLLELVHAKMVAPRRDPEAFAAWQTGRAELVARRLAMPEVVFGDELGATLSGGHRRYRPVTAADILALDLDESLAAWRDRFGDAGDFTFVFTGNLDPATLRPLVERYLASLPATGRREATVDLKVRRPKGVVRKVVKRGVEPKAVVQLTFHGDAAWSRAARRDLEFLAGVLDIRLREILREDLGGVYGVGVYGWIDRVPPSERSFIVRFGCAPENVATLEDAVMKEIARLQRDGVDPSYVAKVSETKRRAHEVALTTNDYWADLLAETALWNEDPQVELSSDAEAGAVDAAAVKAAARRYLDPKRRVVGVLLPAK